MSEIVLPITYRASTFGAGAGDDWLKLEQVKDLEGNAEGFAAWANLTGNLPTDVSDVFAAWEKFVGR